MGVGSSQMRAKSWGGGKKANTHVDTQPLVSCSMEQRWGLLAHPCPPLHCWSVAEASEEQGVTSPPTPHSDVVWHKAALCETFSSTGTIF